jgi:uncharacterized membrane protein
MVVFLSLSSMAASSRVLDQARGVAYAHYDWMAWNIALAVFPLALGALLFRRAVRRTPVWWAGLATFVLFLPNAPYVLTDVIHLFDDIRGTHSDLMLLGVHLPLYLTFFAVGFGSYVAALGLARRYARAELTPLHWTGVELGLHVLCAAGMYLGRVVRLNSWEILTRPRAVVEGMGWLAGVAPVALVACTAAVLLSLTLLTRALVWAAVDAYGRARLMLAALS